MCHWIACSYIRLNPIKSLKNPMHGNENSIDLDPRK